MFNACLIYTVYTWLCAAFRNHPKSFRALSRLVFPVHSSSHSILAMASAWMPQSKELIKHSWYASIVDICWYNHQTIHSWYMLIYVDICWYMLIYVDMGWYMLIFTSFFAFPWIFIHPHAIYLRVPGWWLQQPPTGPKTIVNHFDLGTMHLVVWAHLRLCGVFIGALIVQSPSDCGSQNKDLVVKHS